MAVNCTMENHGLNSTDCYEELSFVVIAYILRISLTVIGVLGNLMIILVVMTVRGMKTPTNCYLVSLACADCLFFLSSTPVELSELHLPENVFVFGRVGCSILRFLPMLSMNASSLSITAFTVERYIGICHPMKARYICTVKRAQTIIIAIWSVSILYNSSWLFLTDLLPLHYPDWPDARKCTFSLSRDSYKAVFTIDMCVFYWVPLGLYLILYGSMGRILVRVAFFEEAGGHEKSKKLWKPSGWNNAKKILRTKNEPSSSSSSPKDAKKVSLLTLNAQTAKIQHRGSDGPKMSTTIVITNCEDAVDVCPNNLLIDCTLDHGEGAGEPDANIKKALNVGQTKTTPGRDSNAYYGESLNKARVQV